MSNSLNKVELIGNLTANPEIKETPNGQKVASFSIATNRKWKDKNDQLQEEVEYHNCVAWRGLADILEKYTEKGKKLYVEGHLKTRTWDDTAGVKRYKTEIVVDNIILLSGNPNASPRQQEEESEFPDDDFEKAKKQAQKARKESNEEISIEDIPF